MHGHMNVKSAKVCELVCSVRYIPAHTSTDTVNNSYTIAISEYLLTSIFMLF